MSYINEKEYMKFRKKVKAAWDLFLEFGIAEPGRYVETIEMFGEACKQVIKEV